MARPGISAPIVCAARQHCKGIITSRQGEQERRITPATVKYCLTLSHYPKAPSFTPQPRIHCLQILEQLGCFFSPHTQHVCDAASWQLRLPAVCMYSCASSKAATEKTCAHLLTEGNDTFFVF